MEEDVLIPEFEQNGYLPPGIHPATIHEVAERFGWQSESREAEMDSLIWLLEAARRARIDRIIIDGSFVSDRLEPIDVDCALLLDPDSESDLKSEIEALQDIPFLHVFAVDSVAFDMLVNDTFAWDRRRVGKGVIEVIAWN